MVKLKLILSVQAEDNKYTEGVILFGLVVANPEKLTKEQREYYKSVYCGLCEELGKDRGFRYRMALTYDLVFLAILLSSVIGEEYNVIKGRCPVHPAKKRIFRKNRFTSYAADMNIALAYYKYIDDWNDDKSYKARLAAGLFEKEVKEIEKRYPYQCREIKKCLDELSLAEKENVLIPDVPAGIFGRLLGAVFAYCDETLSDKLYEFGCSLGKFIYIADAATDLRSDIKKQRYNPLIRFKTGDTEPVLRMIMADCLEAFNSLPVTQNKEILENILLSGIWTSYDTKMKGNRQ